MICPLCLSPEHQLYSQDKNRKYYSCTDCSLIFVSRASILSAEAERARYDTHTNDVQDLRYRDYLGQIVETIKPHLEINELCLDFGSGRTDLLASLLTQNGFPSEVYDLYYFPQPEIWSKTYDAIVLSEVIEHLRDLRETMMNLTKLLRPGGRFFIKTKLMPETVESFEKWYYKKDPTHVEFFSPTSFDKLAEILDLEKPMYLDHDVVMLRASH